jgi:hypothetical protein
MTAGRQVCLARLWVQPDLVRIGTEKGINISTVNTVTIADIKRGGMAALDAALRKGPAHIMKRNRLAAVVLTEEAYAQLLARATPTASGQGSALDMFLAPMPEGTLDRAAVAERLADAAAEWPER